MPDQKGSTQFRRPWIFTNVDFPTVNMLWVAEYMKQHDLSMEVALEHLAERMRVYLKGANETLKLLEESDPAVLRECEAFVVAYKAPEDFYAPIPLVPMFKEPKPK